MKKKSSLYLKKIICLFVIALTVGSIQSCATKAAFQTSNVVPASTGHIKVKKDKNHNFSISIDIRHLAPPDRLQPAKKTYVVWIVTSKDNVKNIGQINSSTGFLSSKLKASFQTVSSFKPTKIFITAENDAAIQYPGSEVVLSTSDF